MLKPKIVIVTVVALCLLGWFSFRHSPQPSSSRLGLSPQPVLAAPAPDVPTPPLDDRTSASAQPVSEPGPPPATSLVARLVKGEELPVTLDQLTAYLQANHRDGQSLLAAYQATHDRALLDEAISKYPNDPRVAFTAWFRSQPAADDPEGLKARRQALDALKQAAPDNALANYLSGANYFKSGQPDLALQELQAGAAKPNYNDYTQDAVQSMTEAYLAAGYPEAEAKLAASCSALLPHLAELKQDGLRLVDLAKTYQQAGDSTSAQATLQMCQDLGQRLDDPNSTTLIQQLVGIALQRMSLDAMAATSSGADTAQGVQERLNALIQEREGIKSLGSTAAMDQWLQTAPPQDIIAYCDRVRVFGEQKTLQWLLNRNSGP